MGISRTALKVWLGCTIVFWIAQGIFVSAGGFFPGHYQAEYPLRTDLEPWQKEWDSSGPLRKPLYDIIRSPSVENAPLTFRWRGWQGERWNLHIHARETPRIDFAGGETLDLPKDLSEADREYVKKVFWDQRWRRWKEIFQPYVLTGIILPLIVLALIWIARQIRIAATGEQPAPEAPRLPYSPLLQELRKITLWLAGAEIVFFLVVALLNDPKDPQPLLNALYALFPLILPALAALIMSLLYRAPRTAIGLAVLGLYFALPELAVRLLPAAWLPGE